MVASKKAGECAGVSSAVRAPCRTRQIAATEKQENVQESNEAHEKESETTEVDETACGKYCSRVVKHISLCIRSVEIVVRLWSVYTPT